MYPTYINLSDARATLAEIGIELSDRQMKRAADLDAHGKRKGRSRAAYYFLPRMADTNATAITLDGAGTSLWSMPG